MFKVLLLAGLLSVAGCADAKSSSSSSSSRSSSSSSYKSSSSSSYKPKPVKSSSGSSYKSSMASSSYKPKPATTTSNRCSGSVNPSVVYDWDDAEYEYECPSKRKMNRFGSCVCK